MKYNIIQFSFNGGELSPKMHGRVDIEKYLSGAAELDNFVVLPQGGISSRTGFEYLRSIQSISEHSLTIPFVPNSSQSFIVLFHGDKIHVLNSDGTFAKKNGTTDPATFIVDLSDEPPETASHYRYIQQVDRLILTHPQLEPMVLKHEGSDEFSLSNITDAKEFKCPPMGRLDTSNTEIRVSDHTHRIKVTCTGADFQESDEGKHIEYKLQDGWALYEIAEVLGPDTALVIPKTAVVKDLDPSARFYLLKSNYPERTFTQSSPDYHELRSNTAVFGHDLEDAYARVDVSEAEVKMEWAVESGSDVFFPVTNLWKKDKTGEDCLYPSGPTWVKFLRYEGQRDYSSELRQGYVPEGYIKSGNIYRIVSNDASDNDPSVNARFAWYNAAPVSSTATAVDPPPDKNKAFVYQREGDTFAASPAMGFHSTPLAVGHWKGKSDRNMLANLSKSQSFDIMRTSAPIDMKDLAGSPVVFNDDDPQTVNIAKLTANKDLFVSTDTGRYIQAKHGSVWVTYRITGVINAREASVKLILSTIPTEKNSTRFVDDGKTSSFTFSLWKDRSYPSAVTIYEQRLVFSGPPHDPEVLSFSKSTDQYDFRTIENDGNVLPTSGISYTLGGAMYNQVSWLSGGRVLLAGTRSSEWQLRSINFAEPLTPANVRITQETFNGSLSDCLRIGSSTLYVNRSGTKVHELIFDYEINAFRSVDLNVMADHLFEDDPIIHTAFQSTPRPTIWVVTRSGKLRSLLFEKDQNVYAWAKHTVASDVPVKSAVVIPSTDSSESGVDRLYLVCLREDKLVLVRQAQDFIDSGEDNFKRRMRTLDFYYVGQLGPDTPLNDDGKLARIQIPANGFHNFEGTVLSLVVNGAYLGEFAVEGGFIFLRRPKVLLEEGNWYMIGMRYTSRLKTLPLSYQVEGGNLFGQTTRIKSFVIQLYKSIGLSYGDGSENLQHVNFHGTMTTTDQSPELFTGFKSDFVFDSDYESAKQIVIEQSQPYPLTILSISASI